MIIKHDDQRTEMRVRMRDGEGTVGIRHILEQEETGGVGRLFAHVTIPPGASIGLHTHEGDFELYHLLKGIAHVTDNGGDGVLQPGDSMLCRDGDNHSIENRGETDIEMIAVVLNSK